MITFLGEIQYYDKNGNLKNISEVTDKIQSITETTNNIIADINNINENIENINIDLNIENGHADGSLEQSNFIYNGEDIIYSDGSIGLKSGSIVPGGRATGFGAIALGGLRYDYTNYSYIQMLENPFESENSFISYNTANLIFENYDAEDNYYTISYIYPKYYSYNGVIYEEKGIFPHITDDHMVVDYYPLGGDRNDSIDVNYEYSQSGTTYKSYTALGTTIINEKGETYSQYVANYKESYIYYDVVNLNPITLRRTGSTRDIVFESYGYYNTLGDGRSYTAYLYRNDSGTININGKLIDVYKNKTVVLDGYFDYYSHYYGGRTPTSAEGNQSFAAGGSVHAIGDWSSAFGKDTIAYQKCSFVIGGGNQVGMTKDEFESKFGVGGKDNNGKTYEQSYSFGFASGADNKVLGYGSVALGGGNTVTGEWTVVGGANNTVASSTSAVFGSKNITSNQYNATFGNGNINDSYGGAIFGAANTATGAYSFTNGTYITNNYKGAIALGNYLRTSSNYQTTLGQYNKSSSDAILIVGNGLSENSRSNAFEVVKDGIKTDRLKALSESDTTIYFDNNLNGGRNSSIWANDVSVLIDNKYTSVSNFIKNNNSPVKVDDIALLADWDPGRTTGMIGIVPTKTSSIYNVYEWNNLAPSDAATPWWYAQDILQGEECYGVCTSFHNGTHGWGGRAFDVAFGVNIQGDLYYFTHFIDSRMIDWNGFGLQIPFNILLNNNTIVNGVVCLSSYSYNNISITKAAIQINGSTVELTPSTDSEQQNTIWISHRIAWNEFGA